MDPLGAGGQKMPSCGAAISFSAAVPWDGGEAPAGSRSDARRSYSGGRTMAVTRDQLMVAMVTPRLGVASMVRTVPLGSVEWIMTM